MNRNEGFTLIETMLVLLLVSILLSFPILSFDKVDEEMKINLFIEEVSSSITLMQNNAIFNSETSLVEVEPGLNRIRFRVMGDSKHLFNHTIKTPEDIQLRGGVKRYLFQRDSGNSGNFERFRMQTTKGDYEFVFQMGSGRFYVRKVE